MYEIRNETQNTDYHQFCQNRHSTERNLSSILSCIQNRPSTFMQSYITIMNTFSLPYFHHHETVRNQYSHHFHSS